MDNQKLQWHPAFQAAMEIEFWDEKDYLQFFPEYNLTKKPLAIDTLIIKMAPGRTIKKNLGQLFRQHNIVEYKSPDEEKSPLYSALMDLVIRANKQQYEEEWKMCDALRELFADELIEREAKGIAEGESKKLIQMTCKKLLKGKTPETISGDLEEDISVISEICDIAKHFAPDYDCDAIYQELQKLHKSE